jgi:lysophospholipase L1-like esterase
MALNLPVKRTSMRSSNVMPIMKQPLIVALGVMLLGGALVSVAQAGTTNLGNIWPLGDSITYGTAVPANVPGGYRDPLYTNLVAKGCTFRFVGTANGNSSAQLTNAGQQWHDGWSGYTIADCTIASVPPRNYSGLYEKVTGWYNSISNKPDVILLMIGINDLNQKYDVAGAPGRLDALVTRLFTLNPNARLLISSLLDADQNNAYRHVPPNTDLAGPVQDYNAAIDSLVASHRALGQNIVFVDMHAGLTLADLSDGLHPLAEGYVKMGNIWADAIIANPPGFTTPAVAVSGGRVSLSAAGGVGTSYSLRTSTNLAGGTWTLLTNGNVTATPFTVTVAATNAIQFYRFSAP